MANDTFLNNVDVSKVDSLLESTDKNTEYFNNIVKNVSESYSNKLDILMKNFYLKQKQVNDIPIEDLEKILLELSNLIYFMGDKLEQLGIHSDLSKAARQEIYNKTYVESQSVESSKKITVAELSAKSEEASKYESVVNSMYDRAYKILKFKIDAAQEMVNSLRKVISRRMQEIDLGKYQPKQNFTYSED